MRHSNEVKPYSLDLLCSLLLITLGWEVWKHRDCVWRKGTLLLVAVAAMFSSYTAVFPALGVCVLLGWGVWRRDKKSAEPIFVIMYTFCLLLSWFANIHLLSQSQIRESSWLVRLTTWKDAFPPLDRPGLIPFWLLQVHTDNGFAYPYGGNNFGSTGTFLLFIVGCQFLFKSNRGRAMLILLLSPIPFALLAAALSRYPYGTSARTMMYLAPAICLVGGVGLSDLLARLFQGRRRSAVRLGVISLLCLIPVVGSILDILMPYKSREDLENRQVVEQLVRDSREIDRWVVFNGANPPPWQNDLMTQRWIQQVAEFKFYCLLKSPVGVFWEQPPKTIPPSSPGKRTWLIMHQSGWDHFPYAQMQEYKSRFEHRFGTPIRSKRYQLGYANEYIEVWEYEARPPWLRDQASSRGTSAASGDPQARSG
jgi:hypothetical protein